MARDDNDYDDGGNDDDDDISDETTDVTRAKIRQLREKNVIRKNI